MMNGDSGKETQWSSSWEGSKKVFVNGKVEIDCNRCKVAEADWRCVDIES